MTKQQKKKLKKKLKKTVEGGTTGKQESSSAKHNTEAEGPNPKSDASVNVKHATDELGELIERPRSYSLPNLTYVVEANEYQYQVDRDFRQEC